MEHRWGWRLRVDLTARVGDATGMTQIARLRDVSVSGAFLETAATLRAHASVDVQFRTHRGTHSRPLSAHVVRATPDGVAVEWVEFAPQEIARLMETHPARARAEPEIELPPAREASPSGAAAGHL